MIPASTLLYFLGFHQAGRTPRAVRPFPAGRDGPRHVSI